MTSARQALLTTVSGVSIEMPVERRSFHVLAHALRCDSYVSGDSLKSSEPASKGLVRISMYADSPVFSGAINAPRPGLKIKRGYTPAIHFPSGVSNWLFLL